MTCVNFLLIETSQETSFVALVQNNVLSPPLFLPKKSQSSQLIPAIESLLQTNDCSLAEFAYIAVGIGPGSFTGTRIGIMVAKTLGWSSNIPVLPFCSLAQFSVSSSKKCALITPAPTLHRPHFFLLSWGKKTGQKTTFFDPPILQKNASFLDSLSPSIDLFSTAPTQIQNHFSSSPLIHSPQLDLEGLVTKLQSDFQQTGGQDPKWVTPFYCDPTLS